MLAQVVPAQSPAGKGPPKGPRALGLVQLAPNGKAHLIPVVILYDGEFYDASAYKAAPVPMALESGTVYEGVRSGVSQGLFTVSSALQGNNTWIGDGTWQTASALEAAAAAAKQRKEARSKPAPEPVEGPPLLRRASSEKPKPQEPAQPTQPSGSAPGPTATVPAPAGSTPTPNPAPPAGATTPPAPPVEEDPDRPRLKRGIPSSAEPKKNDQKKTASAAASKPAAKKPAGAAAPEASSSTQFIPAISDADGPEPRPYAAVLKPEEEEKLRKKILGLAAEEVQSRAAQLAVASVGSPAAASSRPPKAVKLPQPTFDEVQLRIFDLSNSNEPVLVLSTKARMPAAHSGSSADLQYIVTLVARDDIYGELHKAFSNVTDSQHLDVLPRLELVDAVDADGDGRGELLFRQISDAGKAFVLYRVIGDRLWPLFQGTPGQ